MPVNRRTYLFRLLAGSSVFGLALAAAPMTVSVDWHGPHVNANPALADGGEHGGDDHGGDDHGGNDHGGNEHGDNDHGNDDHGNDDHSGADHSGADHSNGDDRAGVGGVLPSTN